MNGEGCVVPRVNEFGALLLSSELLGVGGRADAHPEFAEGFEIRRLLQAFLDVLRGEAFPDGVGEVSGTVIENVDLDARIVSRSQKGVTGAEAGADNAEMVEAFLLQPIETSARIEDRLASSVDGPADIG